MRVLPTLVAVVITTALSTPAAGAHQGAHRWSSTTVSIGVSPRLHASRPEIDRAIAAINRLGIVTLVPAASGGDVVIDGWGDPGLGGLPRGVVGRTRVTSTGAATILASHVDLWVLRDRRTARRFAPQTTQTATHELLHALGLHHDPDGCATMSPSATPRGRTTCPTPPPGRWRCRLIEPRDRDALRLLYGGPRRPVTQRTTCRLPTDAFVATAPLPSDISALRTAGD